MICADTEVEEPRTAIEQRKIPINIQIKTLEICVYFSPGCSSSQSRTRASQRAGAQARHVPSAAPALGLHVVWDCSLHASKGEFCHLFWVRREGGEASGGRGAAAGRPQPSPSNSARLGAVVLHYLLLARHLSPGTSALRFRMRVYQWLVPALMKPIFPPAE